MANHKIKYVRLNKLDPIKIYSGLQSRSQNNRKQILIYDNNLFVQKEQTEYNTNGKKSKHYEWNCNHN